MTKRSLGIFILLTMVACRAIAAVSGDYEVVALRSSSEVAGIPETDTSLLGQEVSFGSSMQWIDGTQCDDWALTLSEEPFLSLEDPNLSDVIIESLEPPVTPEYINAPIYDLRCGNDEQLVAKLVEVDSHVLVTSLPSGTTNVVLQKGYSDEEISRLQSALRDMGLYEGESHGVLGDATRAAVAKYADRRGAQYIFKDVVITENLLDGLDVIN